MNMQLFGRILLALSYVVCARAVFTTTHANNIHTNITTGYNNLVRPSDTVTVRAELSLLTINIVDTKAQMLSTSGWLTLYWTDSRLAWTPATYGDIEYIYLASSNIWKPQLVVENTVSQVKPIDDADLNLLFRVEYTGEVKWDPPGLYKTHCQIDITWYPFDIQTCNIDLTSWGYRSSQVILEHNVTYINLGDYELNGEWEITSQALDTKQLEGEGEEKFFQLVFTIEIDRRPKYYILNVIFPMALVAALTTVTFILPTDSGEKISYILTLLLTLVVLLTTIIADAMPTTSLHTSALGVYLSITLAYAMTATLITVLILRIQVKPKDRKVPRWLQKVCSGFLVKLVRYKKDDVVQLQAGENKPAMKEANNKKTMKNQFQRNSVTPALDPDEDAAKESGEKNPTDCDDIPFDNQEVAEILDRFFFFLFAVLTVLTPVVFMIALGVGATRAA